MRSGHVVPDLHSNPGATSVWREGGRRRSLGTAVPASRDHESPPAPGGPAPDGRDELNDTENRRKGTVMNRTKRIRHRSDAAAVGGRFIGPQVVGPRAIAPTVMAPLALAAAACLLYTSDAADEEDSV